MTVPFAADVASAASHWGRVYGVAVDPSLVHALLERESRHGQDPNYIAHGGIVPEPGGHFSYGPLQLYDDTVRTQLRLGFPAEDLARNPSLGVWYGVKFLAMLLQRSGGDAQAALHHWNQGAGYWPAVTALWDRYRKQLTTGLPVMGLVVLAGALYFAARRRRAA